MSQNSKSTLGCKTSTGLASNLHPLQYLLLAAVALAVPSLRAVPLLGGCSLLTVAAGRRRLGRLAGGGRWALAVTLLVVAVAVALLATVAVALVQG